ncbi:MAG: hypothetical protein ABR507_06610 [Actinomycetota bacterium]
MEIPASLQHRATRWSDLKRWERKELGQDLRRLGLSYGQIASVIPVSKGTLSTWCRDIVAAHPEGVLTAVAAARIRSGATRRQSNLRRTEEIRLEAKAEAAALSCCSGWVAGVVAYWSEGAKSKEVRFSNSDPALMMIFIEWSRCYLGATAEDLAISLQLHTGQDETWARAHWSEATGISPTRFNKTYFKKEGSGHRKKILYFGTASVRVRRSSDLLFKVLGWIDYLADNPVPLGCRGPLAQW